MGEESMYQDGEMEQEGSEYETSGEPEQYQDTEQYQEPQGFNESEYQNSVQRVYEDHYGKATEQYQPYVQVIEQVASQYGMTAEQYLQAINQQKQQAELQQAYNGLDYQTQELVQWIRDEKIRTENSRRAEEESKAFTSEVRDLMQEFPGLEPKDIPDIVYEYKIKNNVPLVFAYSRYALGKERQNIEQQTLSNLEKNKRASVGSLNNPGVDMKQNLSNMSSKDFNSLIEKVKRGEVKHL